jgi:hypothetical protein
MAISNCPMCQTSIAVGETAKSCATCGADLSRWMPKQAVPPLIQPAGHHVQATAQGVQAVAEETGEVSIGFGVAGAVLGACIGSGLMYGFYAMVGLRFPLLGVGIGLLTGFLSKKFAKGPHDILGFASGALAMAAVVGTLYLMYGTFPILSILSVIASVSVAYRIASH